MNILHINMYLDAEMKAAFPIVAKILALSRVSVLRYAKMPPIFAKPLEIIYSAEKEDIGVFS